VLRYIRRASFGCEKGEREGGRPPELRCGGSSFFCGFARFCENFAFGADPVFERVAGSTVAFEVDFVSALRDFFLRGKFLGGEGFTFCR
jgi:hypothetical protein